MIAAQITIEPCPGSSIENVCALATRIANVLDLGVSFSFNGVDCLAQPGIVPNDLAEEWNRVMDSKQVHRFATAHPR